VTTGASAHLARPYRRLGQEKDGRAAANQDLITVAPHTKKDNPAGLPFTHPHHQRLHATATSSHPASRDTRYDLEIQKVLPGTAPRHHPAAQRS
jgi:hypothetical protein